jgi:hypothetical protein
MSAYLAPKLKLGETHPVFNSNRFNKNRYEKLVGTPFVPENKALSNSSIFTEIALEPPPLERTQSVEPEILEIIKGLEEIGILEPAPEPIEEDPKIIVIYEEVHNIDLEVEELEEPK